jgi:hypothetical protein
MTLNEYKNEIDEMSHKLWIFYDITHKMPYSSQLFDAWSNLSKVSAAISELKTEIINEYKVTNAN